jgi:aerobic C4-dicarboxylate transport protein
VKFYRSLYFRVILGVVLGVLLGVFYPRAAESMKPLGDGFIKLIRMMIGPIVFFTVVAGIAGIGDMRKLGRAGLKSLLYFEVVTTAALLIGLMVVTIVQPGAGMNVDPATLDAKAVAQYATQGRELHAVDFLLNIIPTTVTGAFAQGDILQVLLVAILFGLALAAIPRNRAIVDACDRIAHWMFAVVGIIMQAAPFGAFGAMAFTIGKYGLQTLLPLFKLLACVYLTSFAFVFIVLGAIAHAHGFSLWKFLKYIKEELLIVLGTSSSESVLPRMMVKLEELGCGKSVVGLVIRSTWTAPPST